MENEQNNGETVYTYGYDDADVGNRTAYAKTSNGTLVESADYTYNSSNQMEKAKLYSDKKSTTVVYSYDEDGNLF